MNIAFRRGTAKQPLTWFMFCYRGSRFAYDSKWEPRKPSRKDSIGRMLDLWKNEEKDQVSSCSFGDNPDLWFLRSTDGRTEWHATLGPGCTDELHDIFLTELRRTILKQRKNGEEVPVTTLRAVTFGERGSWILYGKTEFFWKDCGMPKKLVEALQKGKKHGWVINVGLVVYSSDNPVNSFRKSCSTHIIAKSTSWYMTMVVFIAASTTTFLTHSGRYWMSGVKV
jgi:hypothetical protein